MKKLMKSSLLFLLLIAVSSCVDRSYETKRQNIIVPGLYEGLNYYRNDMIYLRIKRIYKEEYDFAKGFNVIEDCVRPAYYSLYLYYYDGGVEKEYASFSNFVDAYEEVTNESVAYKDSNNCWFKPCASKPRGENVSPIYCTLLFFNNQTKENYIGSILFLIEE